MRLGTCRNQSTQDSPGSPAVVAPVKKPVVATYYNGPEAALGTVEFALPPIELTFLRALLSAKLSNRHPGRAASPNGSLPKTPLLNIVFSPFDSTCVSRSTCLLRRE